MEGSDSYRLPERIPRPFVPNPEFEELVSEYAFHLCFRNCQNCTAPCSEHMREAREYMYDRYEEQTQDDIQRYRQNPSLAKEEAQASVDDDDPAADWWGAGL